MKQQLRITLPPINFLLGLRGIFCCFCSSPAAAIMFRVLHCYFQILGSAGCSVLPHFNGSPRYCCRSPGKNEEMAVMEAAAGSTGEGSSFLEQQDDLYTSSTVFFSSLLSSVPPFLHLQRVEGAGLD